MFWTALNIAVSKGKFSASAKFTTALTTPSHSLVSLDASSWTLGSARPAQKSWTLDHRCFARVVIKRCTNFGGAVVSVLRADTELLERCQALKQRSIAVMNFSLALVWSCLCGSNARFRSLPLRQRYSNAGFSGAPLKQRSCFPHFVRGDERCSPLHTIQGTLQQRSCGGTRA